VMISIRRRKGGMNALESGIIERWSKEAIT